MKDKRSCLSVYAWTKRGLPCRSVYRAGSDEHDLKCFHRHFWCIGVCKVYKSVKSFHPRSTVVWLCEWLCLWEKSHDVESAKPLALEGCISCHYVSVVCTVYPSYSMIVYLCLFCWLLGWDSLLLFAFLSVKFLAFLSKGNAWSEVNLSHLTHLHQNAWPGLF